MIDGAVTETQMTVLEAMSPYLREHFGKEDQVVTSEIRDKDGIVGSIKDFLGKGK